MSGFSPEWLALREPVDHRSRDARLAVRLADLLKDKAQTTIVDLGSGTGSNLRATAPLLGIRQQWTLVDYDSRLLQAAQERLAAWAERTSEVDDKLILHKAGKEIAVRFRRGDLTRELDEVLGEKPDLVTASALFDLCSADFIERFAATLARHRLVFYTVLTYNGVQTWEPTDPADATMRVAFLSHQGTDKGFGASSGAEAPERLKEAFERMGYAVHEGDSPWQLGAADAGLIAELADGFADAVVETGRVDAGTIASWRAVSRTAAVVGHTDTLALPPR